MSTATSNTPNDTGYENPFDEPLPSELAAQKAQQTQTTSPKDSGFENPFDAPLPSEIAEQKREAALQASRPKSYLQQALQPEGDIQNPMQPAESFALAHPQQQGTLAGAAAIGAGGAALTEAGPVIAAISEHLGNLDKVVQMAKKYGWGADFGYRAAHDLYEKFAGDNKK